jgi:hypothetical protein
MRIRRVIMAGIFGGLLWVGVELARAGNAADSRADCLSARLAQNATQPTATDASGSKSASSSGAKLSWAERWTSPVGTPGMYTGIDTGVTRGPALGASTGTTGTYGAGPASSDIVSAPDESQKSGTNGAAEDRGHIAKAECRQ